MRNRFFLYLLLLLSVSCRVNKSSFSPTKKYGPGQLEQDYSVYRALLEHHHPSLYWYTTQDSMNYYFNWGKNQLKDSLTEPEFRKVLNYVTAKINCGHTTVRSSKTWNKYSDTVRLGKMFPLSFKIWDKAMVVTANLNRRDSVLKRGTLIKKINGRSWEQITDTLCKYISSDGYNLTHKYQTLSNRGFFSSLYTSLFGLSEKYSIEYLDSAGQLKSTTVPLYNPAADPAFQRLPRPARPTQLVPRKERKEQEKNNARLLKIDSANRSAMMDLSTFGRGYGLRKFFRNSFRALRVNRIQDLIIDVRGNGGGSVTNSTLLSRFIADQKFKVSDSLYALRKKSPYQDFIQNNFWNKLFMTFFTRKKKDGYYHFGYFERHHFRPVRKNGFTGNVYILTGGNSFSATTLFINAIIKQENVVVVGEETGGGAYGNSAWLIPDAHLPVTGVRFRLPLFRLVINKEIPKNGRGVQPEIESGPTLNDVKQGTDYKLNKVMELIQMDRKKNVPR